MLGVRIYQHTGGVPSVPCLPATLTIYPVAAEAHTTDESLGASVSPQGGAVPYADAYVTAVATHDCIVSRAL